MNQATLDSNLSLGNRQRGLTLIELMFGILIVAISVVALYYMFITGNTLIMEQYHRRIALEKAEAWMEEIQSYAAVEGQVPESYQRSFSDVLVAPGDPGGEPIVASARITVEPSHALHPDTGVPFYSTVAVEYVWTEHSGREYRIELRSKF